jgi:hypothetical protein
MFWLRFISMPLLTVCVVIHTQTSSITVFDPEGSSPSAGIDVSCVGESCMDSTKERTVHVQRKRYQKIAKHAIWWLKLCGQTAFWECFVFLYHVLNQPQTVTPFCTPYCYPLSNIGMNVLKMGGCVPNSDYSNELPGFIRCEKFLNDQNTCTILRRNVCMELVQYYFLSLCPHTKQNIVECLYGTEFCLSICLGINQM